MTSEALQHEDELLSRPWIWVEDPQWEMADNILPPPLGVALPLSFESQPTTKWPPLRRSQIKKYLNKLEKKNNKTYKHVFFLGFLVTCSCMTGFLVEKNHPLPSLLRPAVHVSLKPLESASRDIRLYLGMWKYGKIMKIMAVNPRNLLDFFLWNFGWILQWFLDVCCIFVGFCNDCMIVSKSFSCFANNLVAPRWFEVCFGWSKRPFWLFASQIWGASNLLVR